MSGLTRSYRLLGCGEIVRSDARRGVRHVAACSDSAVSKRASCAVSDRWQGDVEQRTGELS